MIKNPTVFVIGAGASKPFDFPTGAELRQKLCTGLATGGDISNLLVRLGHSSSSIEEFRRAFQCSALQSIDAFVAYQPKWQQYAEMAIAAALLPIENALRLTTVGNRPGNSDWYGLLWSSLVEGTAAPPDLLNNKVKFITFNYDRSLDQFLLDAISGTYGIDYEKAYEVLQGLPIKHVYGTLGNWIPNFGFGYGGLNEHQFMDRVVSANRTIKTIPSLRGGRDAEAAQWLAEADLVCALGFGFDATNCDRIGFDGACTSKMPREVPRRSIYATSHDLLPAEEAWCQANAFPGGLASIKWLKGDCKTALRHLKRELS
jgi:hypothetical protein